MLQPRESEGKLAWHVNRADNQPQLNAHAAPLEASQVRSPRHMKVQVSAPEKRGWLALEDKAQAAKSRVNSFRRAGHTAKRSPPRDWADSLRAAGTAGAGDPGATPPLPTPRQAWPVHVAASCAHAPYWPTCGRRHG